MDYFHKKESSAEIMALGVHETGRGVGGTYTHEVAETKMKQVLYHADRHGHLAYRAGAGLKVPDFRHFLGFRGKS